MTAEHDVPQDTDNVEKPQPIIQEDINEVLPENEALPENEVLPENKDDRGGIKNEDEIPNELSHPITLIPSTKAVYGMERLINNRKRNYSYQFPSVMHHAMTQVSLKRGTNKFKENGEKAL